MHALELFKWQEPIQKSIQISDLIVIHKYEFFTKLYSVSLSFLLEPLFKQANSDKMILSGLS